MSIVSELKELKPPEIVVAVLAALAIFSPGFLLIFVYKPALVGSLSTLKLLLFSTALSLPVATFNYVLTLIRPLVPSMPFSWFGAIFSLLRASATQYAALLIVYFGGFPFKTYLILLGSFQLIIFICWLVFHHVIGRIRENNP